MLTLSREQNEYSIRNREVQRRSRARRRAYIEDLEKRVRQYQRDGVQATAEVQAAARKVAEENYWLHTLLAKHGVSSAEIKEHLENSKAVSRSLNLHAAEASARRVQPQDLFDYQSQQLPVQVARSSLNPSAPTTLSGGNDLGLPSPTSVGGPQEPQGTFFTVNSAQDDSSPLIHAGTETLDSSSSFEGPQEVTTSCCDHGQQATIPGPDETSCEEAARIIASMRGQRDPKEVWPELGCCATKRCMVKNITIFQMVDE